MFVFCVGVYKIFVGFEVSICLCIFFYIVLCLNVSYLILYGLLIVIGYRMMYFFGCYIVVILKSKDFFVVFVECFIFFVCLVVVFYIKNRDILNVLCSNYGIFCDDVVLVIILYYFFFY